MRDHPLIRLWEWLHNRWSLGKLSLLDRIGGPYPETEEDRTRAREKDLLQRAFPDVEIDGKSPRGDGRR